MINNSIFCSQILLVTVKIFSERLQGTQLVIKYVNFFKGNDSLVNYC
jgi:hypothetical protein